MTLFALSKKVPQIKEGIQKTYVVKPGYFEFGPLLCGKTRDRYEPEWCQWMAECVCISLVFVVRAENLNSNELGATAGVVISYKGYFIV